MTATQAPTPGPLSAEDVKLLVKGDLLRVVRKCEDGPEAGSPVAFERADGNRIWINGDRDSWWFDRFAFIGRPDESSWVPWSGGENPVPGQRVELRLKSGLTSGVFASEEVDWYDPRIIAFRLAPTAPVEASGSEREHWSVLSDLHTIKGWLHGLSTAPDLTDVVADGGVSVGDCYQQEAREFAGRLGRAIEALRPQPSGETREVAFLLDRLADFENDINERDWHGHVAPAVARVKAALSTTPARAEAQDEGAEGEPWGYAARRVRIDGSACEALWTPGKIGDGFYMLTVDDPDWEIITLYAHPSPTPAADDGRVRIAVEALEKIDATPRDRFQVKRMKRYAAEARAALKSEGK